MTYMAVVVSSNTADVHLDVIVSQRLQFSFIAGSRIIYLNGHVEFLVKY